MTENLQNNKITYLIFLQIHIFHIFMHIYFSTHLDIFYYLFCKLQSLFLQLSYLFNIFMIL